MVQCPIHLIKKGIMHHPWILSRGAAQTRAWQFRNSNSERSEFASDREGKIAKGKPADPEGEGCSEHLGGEDAEDAGEEAEEERGASLEEDGVGEAECKGEGVDPNVGGDGPDAEPVGHFFQRLEGAGLVQPVPPARLPHRRDCPHSHRDLPPPASHFPSPWFLQAAQSGDPFSDTVKVGT